MAPYTYAWTFGDGGSAGAQNPSHTYTVAGIYGANLTVTDSNRATATANLVTITVNGRLAATTQAAPTAGDAPLTVAFTGTPTGGSSPYIYTWTFGDGSSSTGQNPSHTYDTTGTYTATLIITDGVSSTASATAAVIVSPSLVVSATASVSRGAAPLAVSFTGAASGGLAPFSYAWTFGDGLSSTSQSPSHTYTIAGTYTANFSVTDANGVRTNATQLTILVTPVLSASATVLPTAGDAPLTATFTSSPQGGTPPYSYAWTFGDGATSNLQNPSHSYTTAGTYTVNLSATDANLRIASASALTITVSPALSVSDGAGASVGNTPLAVSFTSTPSGGLAPYSYAWTFGDGAGSTLQNPSHTYTAAGVDTVNVTVTDANGATASTSALTITAIGPLSVAASATPTIGDAPLTTTLNGSATGGKAPYSYAWDLGDGTVSTATSPSHAYSSVGTYTATVTVSDASGQVSHASAQVAVYPALTVSTLATPASGLASLQVTFTAIANGGLVPYAFAWTYGDGATGSSANGAHSYAAGTFHPTLTVHDAAGGTWSGSAGTITVTSPAVIPPATTPSPPAPAEASPSPETTPSPAAEPSVSPPATPTTGDHNSAPGAGNNGIHVLLLLFGSLFATGLGGALFVRWLRHRIGR